MKLPPTGHLRLNNDGDQDPPATLVGPLKAVANRSEPAAQSWVILLSSERPRTNCDRRRR